MTHIALKTICGRKSSIPYDGENPFDVYNIRVEFPNEESHRLEDLQPGVIIWINQGKITSWRRLSGGKEWWSPNLTVPINNIKLLMNLPLGPSYTDHMRESNNTKKHVK